MFETNVLIQIVSLVFSGLAVGFLAGSFFPRRKNTVALNKDRDERPSGTVIYRPSKLVAKPDAYLVVGNTLMKIKGKLDWARQEFISKGRKFVVNPDHIVYLPRRGLIRRSWKAAIFLSPEGYSIEYMKINGVSAVKRDVASKLLTLKMYADAAESYSELIKDTINVSTKRMMYAVLGMSIAMIIITVIQYLIYTAAINQMGEALQRAWELLRELGGQPPVPGG